MKQQNSLDLCGQKYGDPTIMYVPKNGRSHAGGDKTSAGFNLTHIYEPLFAPLREQSFNFLEIGIFKGQSLAMFHDYFTHATIHGVDITLSSYQQHLNTLLEHGAFRRKNGQQLPIVYQFDATNPQLVKQHLNTHQFGIILDDGDHHPSSQLKTFENLFFDHLEEGGIYIIEDVGNKTTYLDHGPKCQRCNQIDDKCVGEKLINKLTKSLSISELFHRKLLCGTSRRCANFPMNYRKIRDPYIKWVESYTIHVGTIVIRKRRLTGM